MARRVVVWGKGNVGRPAIRAVRANRELELVGVVVSNPEKTIDTPEMGVFEKGTQGAFRFAVQGIVGGEPKIVCEHVTRIDDDLAPDWPRPPAGQRGCYSVIIEGDPSFEVVVQLHGGGGSPADADNATAAGRLVNAIPAVCTARAGILGPLDLPLVTGRGLLR